MREHDHCADELTLNALRHLRQPWRGWERADPGTLRVQTTDGVVVRLGIVHGEPEPGFGVRRLAAHFEQGAVRPVAAVTGFDAGVNDVVVFSGESWLTRLVRDGGAGSGIVVTHGTPMGRPERAEACARTTDAVLVATPRGIVWLVRMGDLPDELEVCTDERDVRQFLEERGYRG